jgi:hypothetical protein
VAAQQRTECDAQFQPCQRCTEAVVGATAERQVLVVLAVGLEGFGVGEYSAVMVCGGQPDHDQVTFRDYGVADFDVLFGEPHHAEGDRPVIAEHLLDGCSDPFWLPDQFGHLPWVAQEE